MVALYPGLGFAVFWVFVLWLSLKIFKGLWTCWLADIFGKNYQWTVTPDSWAVVTGGTDGIGLEYAKAFANKGFNLLIISRNPEKLSNVKTSIESSCKNCKDVRTLAIDFGRPEGNGIYEKIKKEIDSLPKIAVLVNNVGTSYCTPEYYSQLEVTNHENFVDDIININMVSMAKMIKLVLPKMEQQKQGVIINISSISAAYPTPFLSIYAGSKTFVDLMSRSLQSEYQDKGIIIQSVLPSYVVTKLSKIRKPSFLVPSASSYVRGAMKTIGVESRTYGYWTHKLQGFVQDHILAGIFGPEVIVKIARSSLIGIRNQYYKKYVNNKRD